ncbi:MAG: SgcJ/EcaC family oxidoreductase [Akkermansiaceae bacterium]|nr:SgcJ/EcaC family oxidoreductase [Akkermansiaceae bacterium]MCP5548775.1 SgcJ/EcaC family oxidoreductase [Akkermansiaceae bacterium]
MNSRNLAAMLAFAAMPVLLTAQDNDSADPNEAALAALASRAQDFVDRYNQGDSAALASHFVPRGEIVLADGGVVSGREEIKDFYDEVFAGEDDPKGALEAGSVRFVTPGIAIEDGTFHVTKPDGEVVSHYYTAIQVQQDDGGWLTASIRDELEDLAPASEKLIALEWLVGDWLIERDGSRTFLTFSWSEDGPFIDGRALTEIAGESSTSSTYRIGWNNERKNFVSWAFDAEGGYMNAQWTGSDEGWLLRSHGVTADGESNEATQVLVPDSGLQSFVWNTRDQVIGGEVQPDASTRVVKRPPSPKTDTAGEP